MTSRRCTAVCADGSPCRAWAVHGSEPPRCAPHGGGSKPAGAPLGNQNARKHGFYARADLPEDCSIDVIIDHLYQRQVELNAYIEDIVAAGDLSIQELVHLLKTFGQNASRLGRLLRDRRALTGDAADGISGAIAQALQELETELGTPLTPD